MKTIKQWYLVPLLVFLFLCGSCDDDIFVEGNYNPIFETREASGFTSIESDGSYKVLVTQGDEYSVMVRAESNLMSYINTTVSGKSLKIRTRNQYSLHTNYPIEVTITCPKVNELSLSGSGQFIANNIETEALSISISGSGNMDVQTISDKVNSQVSGSGLINLKGKTLETNLNISGSGKIKAFGLEQSFCKSVISGSGDIYVNVSKKIDARISGSGELYYIGFPEIHTSISGSGKVVNKN